jgi:hypothetical protein
MHKRSLRAGLVHEKTGCRDDTRKGVRGVAFLQDEKRVDRVVRRRVGWRAVPEEVAQLRGECRVVHAGEYLCLSAWGDDEALERGEIVERRWTEGERGRRVRGCTWWTEGRNVGNEPAAHVDGIFISVGTVCALD